MLSTGGTEREGIGPADFCGRVEVADHVMFAARSRGDWTVVVNGVVVDQFTNRFAALDLIGRLAQALRGGDAVP